MGSGVWSPRVAVDGSKLPSARLVSISVIPDVNSPDKDHSLWVMQYGQFVDHDLTSTPVFRIGSYHFFFFFFQVIIQLFAFVRIDQKFSFQSQNFDYFIAN